VGAFRSGAAWLFESPRESKGFQIGPITIPWVAGFARYGRMAGLSEISIWLANRAASEPDISKSDHFTELRLLHSQAVEVTSRKY